MTSSDPPLSGDFQDDADRAFEIGSCFGTREPEKTYHTPARRTLRKWRPRHRAAIAAGPGTPRTDPGTPFSGENSRPHRDILGFQGWRHVGGPIAPTPIQNDSGLSQGFACRPAAGCACGNASTAHVPEKWEPVFR